MQSFVKLLKELKELNCETLVTQLLKTLPYRAIVVTTVEPSMSLSDI